MKLLSAICAVCLGSSIAGATTITFSDTQSTTFTSDTLAFSLSQFDPSLGTLTSVKVHYSVGLSSNFQVTNGNPARNGTISGTLGSEFILQGPGGLGMLFDLTPSASLGTHAVPMGSTISFSVLGITDAAMTSINPADFILFLGLGTLNFSSSVDTLTSTMANFTPLTIIQDAMATATVTVTYDYRPVPEPATLALGGLGLAVILVARRRRMN